MFCVKLIKQVMFYSCFSKHTIVLSRCLGNLFWSFCPSMSIHRILRSGLCFSHFLLAFLSVSLPVHRILLTQQSLRHLGTRFLGMCPNLAPPGCFIISFLGIR
ncbi:hypothetical protein FR483_n388L [Paramecium bursaria Chlorella virus FR483]|uniref:Uncharacterized protein n388L n=1 Tax=Paramecium bursaria Chlorella virus FR483 TaxID=399781 RepID=A7J792_PBCVF|nr:hypothetical protein FR483_n388L [Paramecium bursaria Chlorella virus FR483]ABT15673.1 hypothetical protein FR483_n388L [Paramecium bursaria Chlorella virus FR483]